MVDDAGWWVVVSAIYGVKISDLHVIRLLNDIQIDRGNHPPAISHLSTVDQPLTNH